jgi:2-keto-3-deoxy-L-rhamnonate aldolase RhmA
MMRNHLKDNLDSGKPSYGVHLASADLAFYEIAGHIGYDFVWIDTEHAAITLPMVLAGIISCNAGGTSAVVRVARNDPVLAKPILEMGAQAIVFPMINSAEEAEKAVKACMYPPEGERGFGPLRANDYGEIPTNEYRDAANRDILKILQIEHVNAVKNLDEILEVKNIDLLVCGPMDLSASINKLGCMEDKEVLSLMDKIVEKCRNKTIPCGISIGYNIPMIKYWKNKGALFLSMGNPYIYFKQGCKKYLDSVDA